METLQTLGTGNGLLWVALAFLVLALVLLLRPALHVQTYWGGGWDTDGSCDGGGDGGGD